MAARKEELRVELTATDRLSKVVDKAAKAVEDLDGETAKVELTADGDKAEEAIEAVDKGLDELDGQTAEATISANDADAEAEIDAIMRRLQDLDDEEVVAVLSAKATKLEAEIKNANSLLSTIDGKDATAIVNAKDQASAKLRAIRSRLTELDDGLGNVNKSGDQSRSVLANLAGNSAQDIGELGGVVGTLGVGVGQLAEYAVDGNISLKNLAKVAGPLLGVAAASTLISTAINGIKAEQAFRADLVEKFEDALREGVTAASSLYDIVRETGELEFSDEGGLLGLGQETEDLLPVLDRLGISFSQFMQLVESRSVDGGAAVEEFIRQMREELGLTVTEFSPDLDALADGIDQYGQAIADAKVGQEVFNRVMADAAPSIGEINDALQDYDDTQAQTLADWGVVLDDLGDNTELNSEIAVLAWNRLRDELGLTDEQMTELANQKLDDRLDEQADAADRVTEAFGDVIVKAEGTGSALSDTLVGAVGDAIEASQEHADALREGEIAALEEEEAQLTANIEALESYIGAQRDAYDTSVDYSEATEDAEDALADYQKALTETDEETGDLIASQEEINDLGEDFVASVLAQSDALIDKKRAEAAARGETYSATQAIEDQNAALLATASTIPNELLPQFAEMIATINGIPEEKETILTMLREGADPEEILGWLNDISKTRKAAIDVAMNESQRKKVQGQRDAISADTGFTVTANANFSAVYNALAALQRALAIARLARTLAGLATGSSHTPAGTFLAGEQGPELVTLPVGSQVTNAGQTAELLRNGAGGSTTNNYITNNWPRGVPSRDLAAALRRQQRIQGRAF